MPALDTNVLVRYLVKDDAAQFAAASRLIHNCVNAGEAIYVPVTVTLELEWVLRSRYGFDKPVVLQTLSQLLSTTELTFEAEGAVEVALVLYRQGSADFSDGLHVALASAAGQQPLWTFDRAASKVAGARLLAE